MSGRREIRVPMGAYPGSAAARLALLARLGAPGDYEVLRVGEAWMLEALLEHHERLGQAAGGTPGAGAAKGAGAGAARDGRGRRAPRCEAVPRFVRLDAFAPLAFDEPDLALGADLVEALCGARAVRPAGRLAADERVAAVPRAGLCLEQRTLAARLAEGLGARLAEDPRIHAALPDLLPALSPAGLGGLGGPEAEVRALAVLREALRAFGLEVEPAPLGGRGRALPRRVPAQSLGAEGIVLGWARSRGLSWKLGELRAATGLGTIEVQGDLAPETGLGMAGGIDVGGGSGTRGRSSDAGDGAPSGDAVEALAFAPGHPPRPRLYEAAHMQPVLVLDDDEAVGLAFERVLEIPGDATAAGGRKSATRWRLAVQAARTGRELRLRVELADLPAGMRYRLRVPVPYWPRPTRLVRVLDDGRREPCELDGPFGLEAVDGPVELVGDGLTLRVEGAGLHEVELIEVANDCVLAITLLRRRAWDPDRLVRELRFSWS